MKTISDIKNKWLRRVTVIAYAPIAVVLVAILGAAYGIGEWSCDTAYAIRDAWRGR